MITLFLCAWVLPFLAGRSPARGDEPSATLHIVLGEGPSLPATLRVEFERPPSEVMQLLVTNLNLGGQSLPAPDLGLLDALGPDASMLTGWFLVRPSGREFWIGTRLGQRSTVGQVKLPVSNLLKQIDGDPADVDYEILVTTGPSFLRELSETQVKYAPITKITLELPTWAKLDQESSSDVESRRIGAVGPLYEIAVDPSTDHLWTFHIHEVTPLWIRVLKDGFPRFIGPFAGTLALVVAAGAFALQRRMSSRLLQGALITLTAVPLVMLYITARSVNLDPSSTLVEGAPLAGVFTGIALVALHPKLAVSLLSGVIALLKDPKEMNEPAAQGQ